MTIARVPRSLLNSSQGVGVVGADDGVAADADAGRLADAQRGELPHRLVGQGPAAAHHAHAAALVDVAGHDPDLALLAGRDDAGTVGADQARGLAAFRNSCDLDHVQRGDALRDADDQRDPRVGRLHDRVRRRPAAARRSWTRWPRSSGRPAPRCRRSGSPRSSCRPCPGVTPPTTLVPYSRQPTAWNVPCFPIPCTRTRLVLADQDAHARAPRPRPPPSSPLPSCRPR